MKKVISKILGSIATVIVMTACNLVTYEEEDVVSIPSEGISHFIIDHEEGDVTITGEVGLKEIIVNVSYSIIGEEIDAAKTFKENYTLIDLKQVDSEAILTTSITRGAQKEQGNIDLEIRVPPDLIMNYRQKEGELAIFGLNNEIKIQHGTGSIKLTDLAGPINLTDGSGEINFVRTNGSVSIHNGSGTLSVTDSVGDLSVVSGSGSINISAYNGPVSIRSGEGNVVVKDIDGDVTIVGNTGGEITIEEVSGKIIRP